MKSRPFNLTSKLSQLALFTVLALGLIASSQASLAQEAAPAPSKLQDYAEVLHAKGAYEVALSQASINYAEAELVRAQAAMQWQRVRALTLLINHLSFELRSLRKKTAQLNKKVRIIERVTGSADRILGGTIDSTTLRSLHLVMARYVTPGAVGEAMSLPVEPVAITDFQEESSRSTLKGFAGGNLGQLLSHLRANKLELTPWVPAHFTLIEAMGIISEPALIEKQQIQEQLKELPSLIPSSVENQLGAVAS